MSILNTFSFLLHQDTLRSISHYISLHTQLPIHPQPHSVMPFLILKLSQFLAPTSQNGQLSRPIPCINLYTSSGLQPISSEYLILCIKQKTHTFSDTHYILCYCVWVCYFSVSKIPSRRGFFIFL